MRIAAILSKRRVENWPSYHIIYEWEDVLAAKLGVPIVDAQPWWRKLLMNRYAKRAASLVGADTFGHLNERVEALGRRGGAAKNLVFELYVSSEPAFSTSGRAIPVMIDFWKHTNLPAFYQQYKHCALVLISSLEALRYLQAQGCPLRLAHFPLSLADEYRPVPGVVYPKSYEVLFAGRANAVLLGYMQQFVAKYPETEFLQQEQLDGELYYVSNKRGIIGKFHARHEYMKLLQSARVSFYSTPGIDGGEGRTGGFNPVTPRYLELLSAQCLLLGRYPDNEETRYYEVSRVCPNITSYDEFEKTMREYLSQQSPNFEVYRDILAKHYTSCRARQLVELLGE